ncbi:hypothetical protein FACS189443_1890 [Planctomycetales bacterium]|nr:hypothetical protein FACS189443_1890 [Planctomycetales bacterium]
MKTPSSDIVKPQTEDKKSARNIGAQTGHQQPPFPAEKSDEVIEHESANGPDCGHSFQATGESAKIQQQIELVEKPIIITEHKTYT